MKKVHLFAVYVESVWNGMKESYPSHTMSQIFYMNCGSIIAECSYYYICHFFLL